MDEQFSGLANRLARVEKELRFWRYAVAALAIFIVAGADSSRDEITAKKITITGSQGEPLITLGSWAQGTGGLIIVKSIEGAESPSPAESLRRHLELSKELGDKWGAAIVGLPGHAEIELSSKDSAAGHAGKMDIGPTGLGFYTAGGRSVGLNASDPYESEYQGRKQTVGGAVSLVLSETTVSSTSAHGREVEVSLVKGASQLLFNDFTDKATTTRADFMIDPDGTPEFHLFDKSEHSAFAAVVPPSGEPVMILSSARDKARLDLHITNGQPRLDLFGARPHDREWKPRVSLLAESDGLSALMFSDKDSGPVRTSIGVKNDGKPFLYPPGP